jgi:hypothetical protein
VQSVSEDELANAKSFSQHCVDLQGAHDLRTAALLSHTGQRDAPTPFCLQGFSSIFGGERKHHEFGASKVPADSEILREIRELPLGGAAALAKLSPIGY